MSPEELRAEFEALQQELIALHTELQFEREFSQHLAEKLDAIESRNEEID